MTPEAQVWSNEIKTRGLVCFRQVVRPNLTYQRKSQSVLLLLVVALRQLWRCTDSSLPTHGDAVLSRNWGIINPLSREFSMSVLDSLSGLLGKYMSDEKQNTADAAEHFDQVAHAVPQNVVANGLAEVFRSNQTPAFGNLVSQLFSNSTGEQKAGVLNQILATVGPGALAEIAGGGVVAELLGSTNKGVTPEQAQNVSSQMVEQLATHAENKDPSIVDRASAFYAQHPTLVKTLGGAALSIALRKVAERQNAA